MIDALNATIDELPTEEEKGEWTGYGYRVFLGGREGMWYLDRTYGEEKYRGVYFTKYRLSDSQFVDAISAQPNNGYTIGNVYWFKYEPIRWNVIKTEDGKALLCGEKILDAQAFCDMTTYNADEDKYYNGTEDVPNGTFANNYAYSSIRNWLNNTFYQTAFDKDERADVLLTRVDNTVDPSVPNLQSKVNPYLCESTTDRVFLIGLVDVTNEEYAFEGRSLLKKATDYALCMGLQPSNDEGEFADAANWWLRTPYYARSDSVKQVSYKGSTYSAVIVDRTGMGVVPALTISLP